jgi:hypothetical protein
MGGFGGPLSLLLLASAVLVLHLSVQGVDAQPDVDITDFWGPRQTRFRQYTDG